MTQIILIRCPATAWSMQGRIQGDIDVPLDEKGAGRCLEIAARMEGMHIDAVYSSPLSRCAGLAGQIAQAHRLKVKKCSMLTEYHQGLWQGLTKTEIKDRYKKHFARWEETPFLVTPPRGEAPQEVFDRIISGIQKLVDYHNDQTICIVTHQLISVIIKCHYNGLDLKGRVWDYEIPSGEWEIIELENVPINSLR